MVITTRQLCDRGIRGDRTVTLNLEHSSIVILFSGVAFLLLGLSMASESLQKLAANQIRKILNRLDESGVMSVVLGTLLTLMMQSSGALTATLVNLGTARVLTLSQVMGVLIGSAIGAALTVQLISFHVSFLGLPVFILGFIGAFMSKKRKLKGFFEFVIGVGLLFFGLEMISLGSRALIAGPVVANAFEMLKSNWIAVFFLSAALTTVFHSSTATLGVVMGLAASGALRVEDALAWIYGANIGTTSTALVASMRANYIGRQIAWANFLYRTTSVIIFLPFASTVLFYVPDLAPTVGQQVALIYLVLNLFAASIFFPLKKFGVVLIQKVITPGEADKEFGVKYLKRSSYESFALGVAHARREVLEMGDIVYQMAELSLEVFRDEDPDLVIRIRNLDDRVDLLLKEIKLFLIRVSDLSPEGLDQSVIDIISFGTDLEGAADIIDHHLLGLAKKKRKQRLEFSAEGWRDLEAIHHNSVRATSLSTMYFQTEDKKLAEQLANLKAESRDLETQSRAAHIARLGGEGRDNMGTSAIFLETLNTYLQLVEFLSRHAKRTTKAARSGQLNS